MERDGAATERRRGRQAPVPEATEVEGLVRSLVGMVREGGIGELDVAYGRVSIRLRAAALAPDGTVAPEAVAAGTEAGAADPSRESVISAPMIGTFYASPSPGEPPYVEVGDPVLVGQTVGIIEAMKIMNEITADRAGVVAAVLVGNGQPVEYGSPLLRLLDAGDEPA